MTIVQQIPVGINYTLHIKRGLVYIVYSDVVLVTIINITINKQFKCINAHLLKFS